MKILIQCIIKVVSRKWDVFWTSSYYAGSFVTLIHAMLISIFTNAHAEIWLLTTRSLYFQAEKKCNLQGKNCGSMDYAWVIFLHILIIPWLLAISHHHFVLGKTVFTFFLFEVSRKIIFLLPEHVVRLQTRFLFSDAFFAGIMLLISSCMLVLWLCPEKVLKHSKK